MCSLCYGNGVGCNCGCPNRGCKEKVEDFRNKIEYLHSAKTDEEYEKRLEEVRIKN